MENRSKDAIVHVFTNQKRYCIRAVLNASVINLLLVIPFSYRLLMRQLRGLEGIPSPLQSNKDLLLVITPVSCDNTENTHPERIHQHQMPNQQYVY